MVEMSVEHLDEGDQLSDEDNIVCCGTDMTVFSGGLECGDCASFVLVAPSGLITGITIHP